MSLEDAVPTPSTVDGSFVVRVYHLRMGCIRLVLVHKQASSDSIPSPAPRKAALLTLHRYKIPSYPRYDFIVRKVQTDQQANGSFKGQSNEGRTDNRKKGRWSHIFLSFSSFRERICSLGRGFVLLCVLACLFVC
jgi:hypothetical protein